MAAARASRRSPSVWPARPRRCAKPSGTTPSAWNDPGSNPGCAGRGRRLARSGAGGAEAGSDPGLEVAIDEAIDVLTAAMTVPPTEASNRRRASFGLTPRETEVLRLLARHYTDREIADALSISPRTAMHHVSHILAKLGVATPPRCRRPGPPLDGCRLSRSHGQTRPDRTKNRRLNR